MRNNKRALTIIITVLMVLMVTSLFAQTESVKVSGLAFGDYYYVARHHNQELESRNGFWLRRVYLTFDHKFDDNLSARIRFEAASPGDFKNSDKIEPFLKHLYLQWKASDNHTLYFGLSGPPTYGVVEEVWGYRHLEKTPLDLYGFAPSSDFGVALKGKLNSQLKYHGMVSNGSGTGAETNSGKRASLSLGYFPNNKFVLEGYIDTESRSENDNRQTYQVFAALRNDKDRIGFLLTRVHSSQLAVKENRDLVSIFAIRNLKTDLAIVARYDRMFSPNPTGDKIAYLPFDPTAKSNLYILGIDYRINDNLSFIPNLEYVKYDGTTPIPRNDILSRFTLYYVF